MKNLRHIILACLAILCFSPRVHSQAILSIAGNEIIGMPDTVQYGDTLKNMAVWVKNEGNLPTPGLLVTVNSLINSTVQGQIIGTLNLVVALLPGDSVVVPLDAFVVSPANSNNGANIVVVWPASPGTQPGDTLEDSYYVDDITSRDEAFIQGETEPIFLIYPNPAREVISLQTSGPLHGEVFIYDLNGKMLLRTELQHRTIDLQGLAPGSYFLEFKEMDGSAARKRFVKL